MRVTLRLVVCAVILSVPFAARAQESSSVSGAQALTMEPAPISKRLPDAPVPQDEGLAVTGDQQQASIAAQSGSAQASPEASSSSQAPTAQTDTEKSQHDKAEEQLKQQE